MGIDKVSAREDNSLGYIIECLEGSYTQSGIDKWFDRPRQSLGGKTPNQIFNEEPEKIELVVKLAESLRYL